MTEARRVGEGDVYGAPLDGRPFADEPREGEWLAEVRTYFDYRGLQGILSVWVGADGARREGVLHGYPNGQHQVHVIDVADEEIVQSSAVRRGMWIDALLLKTNRGRQVKVGNVTGGGLVVAAVPVGGMVVGFWGREGGSVGVGIRAIAPIVVDAIPAAPRLPAEPKQDTASKLAARDPLRFDWKLFGGAGFGGWRGFRR